MTYEGAYRSEHRNDPEFDRWIANNLSYGFTHFSISHAVPGQWTEVDKRTRDVFSMVNSHM